jgi:uncharacterized protein (TIGR02996 family)
MPRHRFAEFEALLSDPHAAALLRVVQAESDNDALRLVYADWLEERGDPRAEYLRLECLLAKGEPPRTGCAAGWKW